MRDLIIMVPDKDTEFTLRGALTRHQSLSIRPIEFEIMHGLGHDGGTRAHGPELLALKRTMFRHALLILDFEGSGAEQNSARDLENSLDQRLFQSWGRDAKSIVIYPEVDIWIWGKDSILAEIFGWTHNESIRDWLKQQNFEFNCDSKPVRPKEAVRKVLREARLPPSASIYREVASRVSLKNCTDSTFLRLAEKLREWFPLSS